MEKKILTSKMLDDMRGIEGFPVAEDEKIIELSLAPNYTACPNPFIGEFVEEYGCEYDELTDDYSCDPFSADVSEGKNDAIYNAHS